MLIDTHCHLDASEFDVDRDSEAAAARAAGVGMIVIPAIDVGNFATVAMLGRRLPGACYALGIHPLRVGQSQEQDLIALREALRASIDDPRLVAVGEIGLDHFVQGEDRARQRHFFVKQLELAREFDLPVLLHVRRAQDEVLRELRRTRPSGGIAHAFNGSFQQAGIFLDLGFALGFGGTLTYARSLQIRRLVTDLPAEAHVLETDAPDIAPSWIRQQRNSPRELPRIAGEFASLRDVSAAEAIARTASNACRVLPRLKGLLDSLAS